ncbi:MAG TPA: tetratricopeptide repeat protein [Planctomycetes bacterium]|nr:tetratricopeptide repeat protein [Planctomycetota bacterium]
MDLSKHLEKAEEARKRRNYPLAIGLYHQILDLDPDQEAARKGLRLALDGKFEGKNAGSSLAYVTGLLSLLSAKIAGMTKNHRGQVRSLERFLVSGPGLVGPNLSLGAALEAGGWLKSAYAVYRHLGERLSAGGRSGARVQEAGFAWRRAGAAAYSLGRIQDAMECYEKAVELNPRDQDALKARKNLAAEGAIEKGGFDRAKSSRELIKDKTQHQKLEKAQRIHRSKEELEAEREELEAALKKTPQDLELMKKLGALRGRLKDYGGALDLLERALTLAPGDRSLADLVGRYQVLEIEAQIQRAEKLEDEAKVRRLREDLRGVRLRASRARVEAAPTDLAARFELGMALAEAGQDDEAIAELQKAVQDPRFRLDALLQLGKSFARKGLPDLARAQYQKALEDGGARDEQRLELLFELGKLAEDQGQREAAMDAYKKILEVDIGYQDVAQRLEALRQ